MAGAPRPATRRRPVDQRMLLDIAVATLIGVFSVLEVAGVSRNPDRGERAADVWAYALVVVAAAALAWRRRAPMRVLAVVTVAVALFWLCGYGALLSLLGLPAIYSVTAYADDRRAAWTVTAVACGVLLVSASVSVLDEADGFDLLTALSMAAFLVAAAVAGVVMRNRERIFVDSERRAAEAEADRAAEAERAVASERARIAREMHDVVAHGMSVIAVQAAAGQAVVHTDPDRAAEVFARIESVGRESLGELRRMLGVLRDGGDGSASLSPQPAIADIATAVAEAGATGLATELVVEGAARGLPPGVELAAYRIVQEALTNVLKHAGASAHAVVRITYDADALVVEVVDDGRGAVTSLFAGGAGHGLIGMRERVAIYGGELVAGPRRGGGYRVRATFPVGSDGSSPAGEDPSGNRAQHGAPAGSPAEPRP